MTDSVGPKQQENKKYGLIIPNKSKGQVQKPTTRLKPCVFNDDDDDDEAAFDEEERQKPQGKLKVNTNETRIKKQTQINIEKALEQDPNIFEYDQIYDKLEQDKHKADPKYQQQQQSKEPKYIAGIMKSAALRQIEFEKRQDRKIQKERELEGDLFGDKEAFVTEAYRKRMEERARLEEEQRRQELDESMDVTKMKDMRGFYDSMLKLKTGELVIEEESEKLKRLERERAEKLKKEEEAGKFGKKKSTATSKTFRSKADQESSDSEPEEAKIATDLDKDEVLSEVDESTEKSGKRAQTDGSDVEAIKEPEFKKPKLDEPPVVAAEIAKRPETKAERWKRLFTKRTVGKVYDAFVSDYFRRRDSVLSAKSYIERD